ncbi:ABC transporter substrate-binding protein [Paenirhodobacter sp.]|uniref:ABC transporter substrate-binding protein n=1 Tax=Paenirhodobacter sp. TaxID=1965326 RepID=UPI003B40DFDE
MTPYFAFGRRSFLLGASALALFAPAAARAASSSTVAPKGAPVSGGTLIVGQYQEPTFFDPNRQYSYETYRLDKHIYESLVAEDLSTPAEDGPPPLVPALAESWEISPDAKTFTFHLRKGVNFHDGTDFDAEAVRFNVRRFTDDTFEYFDARSQATMTRVYGDLTEVRVLDSHTVQYVFSRPFLEFLRLLPQGNFVSGIFSPKALQTWGQDDLAAHPTGTGPYRFVERVHGEKTVLERNPDYWGKAPLSDRIVFRPIQDDNTRLAALRSGEIDILTRTPVDAVEGLEAEGYQVLQSPGASLLFLEWNFRNEFAAKREIRQAIIQAINRAELAKVILRGHADPAYNILNVGNDAYDPAQKDYAYDPEASRRLIAEAGYKEGEIKFTLITDEANQQVLEWVQRDLAAVGIKAELVSQEWLVYTANLGKLTPDIAAYAMEWGFVTPYWLKIVYDLYIVSRGGGEAFVGDKLAPAIQAAADATDRTEALKLWKAANAEFAHQVGAIPLATFTRYYTTAPQVRGFNVPQQNFYDLSPVWIEK